MGNYRKESIKMLIKFAVTNYRGFAQRIEWDLSHPSNYSFNEYAIKDGVIKNGIIYGPNGSGKSNMAFALFDIVNHLSQKMKMADYYVNFVYAGNQSAPVVFEYTFKFGNDILEYIYSKRANGTLLTEKILVNRKQVFNRDEHSFTIDDKQFPMDNNMKANLYDNANNVSVVNFLLTSYPLNKEHYFIHLQDFVANMLWFRGLKENEYMGFDSLVTNLDQYIIAHNLVKDFEEFLHDVSEQTFHFADPHPGDKMLVCQYGDAQIPFDAIASTGTQSLMLLYFWLTQLDKASFVFVDEFDAFYHFKLSYAVCKRLFSLNCQAFTSSHNTYLMTNDLLRPDCNFILNNNLIKPLNECTEKELRFGHNIEKMFRGGAFAV